MIGLKWYFGETETAWIIKQSIYLSQNVVFQMPGFSLVLDLLLEGRVLHKGAWIAVILGTLLEVQNNKKV